MLPSEIAGINYLVPESPTFLPNNNFSMLQNHMPSFHFNGLMTNYSTSDEADEQQQQQTSAIINERKQRRMISNRESARRSRMRKQKHLDELWSQVVWLRTENHSLVNKLSQVLERHDRVVQENARLKEEASGLRRMLTDLQIVGGPYSALKDLEDSTCNTAHLRAESSNHSITTSTNLLH